MPREAFSRDIQYNLKDHRSYLKIGNQLAKKKLIQHGQSWVLCPSLFRANPNKGTGFKILLSLGVWGSCVATVHFSPQTFSVLTTCRFYFFSFEKQGLLTTRQLWIIQNMQRVSGWYLAVRGEKTSWSLWRLCHVLSQIQCFPAPFLWRCSFILFPIYTNLFCST